MRSLEHEFGDVRLMQVVWLGRDMGVLLRQPPRYHAFRLLLTGVTHWQIRGEEAYASPPLGWEGFLKRTDGGWLLQITFSGLFLEVESEDVEVSEAEWDAATGFEAVNFIKRSAMQGLELLTGSHVGALEGRLQGIAWGHFGDLSLVLVESGGSEIILGFDPLFDIRLDIGAEDFETVRWRAEFSEETDSSTTTVLRPIGVETQNELRVEAGKVRCWRVHPDNA